MKDRIALPICLQINKAIKIIINMECFGCIIGSRQEMVILKENLIKMKNYCRTTISNKNQGVMQTPNYEILETIGDGGFAIVYKARREKDSLLLAIKVPRIPYKDFVKEFTVLLLLNNHSISILSNMIYTRLTTKNSVFAIVELAYHVFQLSDDYERAIFWIKN
jgi:serine/threonine protein kinase